MRLGTQTGSLVNHLQSRAIIGQPRPVVGMGATVLGWTDRYPATVVDVKFLGPNGRFLVTVQEDNAVRSDRNGMSESQSYNFTANPDGRKITYRQSKDDSWEEVRLATSGRWNKVNGYGLRLGERDKYHDFSF